MKDRSYLRMRRAIVSLHRTQMLVPVIGLAAISVSAYAMAALAQAYPETAMLSEGVAQCNPFESDFGCGHGFGCACHLLPEAEQTI